MSSFRWKLSPMYLTPFYSFHNPGQLFRLWWNQGPHPSVLATVSFFLFLCSRSSHSCQSVSACFPQSTQNWSHVDVLQVLQYIRLGGQTATPGCLPWRSIAVPHNTFHHPEPLQVWAHTETHLRICTHVTALDNTSMKTGDVVVFQCFCCFFKLFV